MIKVVNILDVKDYIDKFDVVIFDLDDTLYSEKDYVRSGFKLISQRFNDDRLEYDLWESFTKHEKAIDVIFDRYNLVNYKEEAIEIYRLQKPNIHCYPGIYEMLSEIKLEKKLALITDGRIEGQKLKIASLGIEKLFDKIIITDELGGVEYRKPNAISFILMSEFFNVGFDKMCYIGDNMRKDFIAPEKLGMGTIWFNNMDGLYYD